MDVLFRKTVPIVAFLKLAYAERAERTLRERFIFDQKVKLKMMIIQSPAQILANVIQRLMREIIMSSFRRRVPEPVLGTGAPP